MRAKTQKLGYVLKKNHNYNYFGHDSDHGYVA